MKRITHLYLPVALALAVAVTAPSCSDNDREKVPNADDTAGAAAVPGAVTDTPGAAGAADTMGSPAAASGQFTDANIFAKLDAANSEEVDEGKLGSEKAKSSGVKKFAQMLVTDHSKMRSEGADLASRLNISPQLPAGDTSAMKVQHMMDMLRSADGASFDSVFIAMQIECHQMTLDDLKMMQGVATNDSLKALIGRAMPVVQGHLDEARSLQGKMK